MRLCARRAARAQLDMRRGRLKRPAAQRKEAALHRGEVVRNVPLPPKRLPMNLHARLLRERLQPREAEVDRCEEASVRRAVVVRLDRQRQRFAVPVHVDELSGKRRRDHVKAVDEDVLPVEHAASAQPGAHFQRNILRVRQLAAHALLIPRVDAPDVEQLRLRRVAVLKRLRLCKQLLRGQAAALEVREDRGDLRDEALRTAHRRAAVDGQAFRLFFDDAAEHHALAPLVKDRLRWLACALEDAALQPAR